MMQSLAEYIDREKLTVDAFGDLAGISRQHVHRLITGVRHPSLELLDKLQRITKIPLEKLFREALGQ